MFIIMVFFSEKKENKIVKYISRMLSTNQSQSEILSARQGESTSAESKRKSENIVPVYKSENIVSVYIKDIHDCTDEGFTIEGIKVGMIVIVGQVKYLYTIC